MKTVVKLQVWIPLELRKHTITTIWMDLALPLNNCRIKCQVSSNGMDDEIKAFKKILRENGHFVTKPRLRLFAILQSHPALSIGELIKLLNRHDQATVYRNIIVFETLGVINRLWLGWNSKLELSDRFRRHHHHLTCLNCGLTIAIDEDPALEQKIILLAKAKNFQPTDHQLEIRGLCQDCQGRT